MDYEQLKNLNILVQVYRNGYMPAAVYLPIDKCINIKKELTKQLRKNGYCNIKSCKYILKLMYYDKIHKKILDKCHEIGEIKNGDNFYITTKNDRMFYS